MTNKNNTKPKASSNVPEDHILKVWGEATIRNGDYTQHAYNKILNEGLLTMLNKLINYNFTASNNETTQKNEQLVFWHSDITKTKIDLGTNGAASSAGTTALVASLGINPDSVSVTRANPATGQYQAIISATWNSGTLGASTVQEIGVLTTNHTDTSLVNDDVAGSNPASLTTFSRLSTGDSEFSSFTINPAFPLTVEWKLNFEF